MGRGDSGTEADMANGKSPILGFPPVSETAGNIEKLKSCGKLRKKRFSYDFPLVRIALQ